MILEYLQPDPQALDGAVVLARGVENAATLVAAGLGFFLVAFGHRLREKESARLRTHLGIAAIAALVVAGTGMVLRAAVLSGGETLADAAIWDALIRSRNGDAFFVRIGGLVLMLAALTRWRLGPTLAAIGACTAIASYAAVGHSTSIAPRQEIVAFLIVHLVAIAFWVGSLPVLATVALREDKGAADLVDDWGRAAMVAVPVLLASAGLLVWYLKAGKPIDFSGWYDYVLVAKASLVSIGLGLALLNRARLTPALRRGETGAGHRLATSVRIEFVVLLLVLVTASELVSIHPNPPAPAPAAAPAAAG